MKKAEEIVNEILVDVENRPVFFREQDVVDLIAQAQKEAYNQAIDDAAKSAVAYDTEPRPRFYSSCVVDEESILKLKK